MAKVHFGVSPTSTVLRVKLMDSSSTTGAGITGLSFSATGLRISTIQTGELSATSYTAAGSTIETITTLGTYAAPTATKCRFKEVDATNHPGIYELQIADARFASTNTLLISVTGATNLAQADLEVQCSNLAANVIQAAGTAWASGAITDAVFAAATYPKALRTATAQSGAAGYIQLDASASATNDLYTGCSIKITGGTGIGQSRTIILYVGSTQRAYVDRVWATNPANDSVFVINTGKLTADIVNTGVATAGGASSITLAATAVATDAYYDGDIIQIISGTGVGQSRVITGYVGGTLVATVWEAWAVQPDNTSVYIVRGLGDVEANVMGVNSVSQTGGDLSAQIAAIGSGSSASLNFAAAEDNASTPIKTVSKVGTPTGTYVDTSADDGSSHIIASVTNVIDWVYGFDVGSAKAASKITWKGILTGTGPNSDTFTFQAYRFDTSAWETRYVIVNTTATTQTFDIALLGRNTGTSGADKGKVYIRVLFSEADAGTITTNLLLVQAQQSGSLVGYSDGAVWLNTAISNTNTVPYVDGVADNPVSTIAATLTLLAALNMKRIRIANGSTIALGASIANYSMIGKNWTLALGGQAIDGAYFEGAEVSGTGTCTVQPTFYECHINAGTTTGPAKFHRCGFSGSSGSPFVAGSAGEFIITDCYSEVAGSGTPYFTLSGASGINFRRWSGGSNITLNNASATLTMEVVTGGGQTIAVAGASVEIRGICRAVTLTGIASTTTAQIDAVTGPISLAGADGTVRVYGVCATVTDSRTGSPTLTNQALSQITIPDVTWDEILTGSSHNIATSAGRRLRQLASQTVWEGVAQGPGTNGNQIQLDTGASSVDGSYDPSLVAIVGGTGAGQCRLIYDYVGSTRMATVDRDWKVAPSTDSEFIIYAHPGREHVNEGLARSGGGASSVKLNANASTLDDNYVGQLIFIRSGTGQDQVRLITAYNGTTQIATVSEPWGVEPDTTSGYAMLPYHGHEPSEVAASVWDKARSGHTNSGTFGEYVNSDVVKINSVATTSVTAVNANQGTTQPINFTGTGASALTKADLIDIVGAAVNTALAQIGVNVVSQDNIDFGALQKASLNAATPASVTGAVGSVTSPVTVGINNDKTNYTLSASEHTAIGSDAASAILITPANKIDTDTSGRTNIGQVYSVSAAARQLSISAPTMADGYVTSASFAPTTTQFESSYITKADPNFFTNRTAIFTSGVLNQQARNISGYEKVGANGRFTVDPLTEAPADGDGFIIV